MTTHLHTISERAEQPVAASVLRPAQFMDKLNRKIPVNGIFKPVNSF